MQKYLDLAMQLFALLSASGMIGRAFAATLGPKIKDRWPNAYAWLAAFAAFAMAVLPDLVASYPSARRAFDRAKGGES